MGCYTLGEVEVLTVARQAGHSFGSTLQVSQPGSAQVALRGQRGGMLWDASRYGEMGWG